MQISSFPNPARFKAQTTSGKATLRGYIPYAAVPVALICLISRPDREEGREFLLQHDCDALVYITDFLYTGTLG